MATREEKDDEIRTQLPGHHAQAHTYLPDTVKPLQEDRRPLLVGVVLVAMATAPGKHVPKAAPVLLNKDGKALQGAIERVKEKLCEGAELGRPIPAIAAVDKAVLGVFDKLDDFARTAQHSVDMLEPLGVLQIRQPVLVVRCVDTVTKFRKHRLAVAHVVDVLDVQENDLDVVVPVRQLVPFPHGHVPDGGFARPCVEDDRHIARFQMVLVEAAPITRQPHHRLLDCAAVNATRRDAQ